MLIKHMTAAGLVQNFIMCFQVDLAYKWSNGAWKDIIEMSEIWRSDRVPFFYYWVDLNRMKCLQFCWWKSSFVHKGSISCQLASAHKWVKQYRKVLYWAKKWGMALKWECAWINQQVMRILASLNLKCLSTNESFILTLLQSIVAIAT